MTTHVLRGRVPDVIDSPFDGACVEGGRKGRIDQRFDVVSFADRDEGFEIDYREVRVRR